MSIFSDNSFVISVTGTFADVSMTTLGTHYCRPANSLVCGARAPLTDCACSVKRYSLPKRAPGPIKCHGEKAFCESSTAKRS